MYFFHHCFIVLFQYLDIFFTLKVKKIHEKWTQTINMENITSITTTTTTTTTTVKKIPNCSYFNTKMARSQTIEPIKKLTV